jgi:hypothetical protein
MEKTMPLDILPKFRGNLGQFAGGLDELQSRIRYRASRLQGRRGAGKLHDTIVDSLVDQLFVIAEHLRTQMMEALSVIAIGPIGGKAVDGIDEITGKALDTIKELAAKVDQMFDAVDGVVDLIEKITVVPEVAEKGTKIGTRILNRLMGVVDHLIEALDRR